jgi:hypothetical protein
MQSEFGGQMKDQSGDGSLMQANRKKIVTAKRRKELLHLSCDFAGMIEQKGVEQHERHLFLSFVDTMSSGDERA